MLFFDWEVYKYDWLVVIGDTETERFYTFHNDTEGLSTYYNAHKTDIWCGYNCRNYDQWVHKGVLAGLNPKKINDWIIVKNKKGYQYSSLLKEFPLIFFDIMPNPPIGLKTLEAFMGINIHETDVDFNLDRPLTPEEVKLVQKYCQDDVEATMEVFMQRKEQFDSMLFIVNEFKLPLPSIGKSEAQITAEVLDCHKCNFDDEFDFIIEDCVELNKYRDVLNWFRNAKEDCKKEMIAAGKNYKDAEEWHKFFYDRSFTYNVSGVPHVSGWGGLHGAPVEPLHRKGAIYHVDVGSYYPSYLIAHKRITRAALHPEQYKNVYDARMALKKAGKKKEQAPYKKMLNALSGAMKDKYNPAYDPCMNNTMCVNCQLMTVMLLEMLEQANIPGYELIQTNTDGLIVMCDDTDEAFEMMDDVCYAWECKVSTPECGILLGLDTIKEIYQKDVNNYVFIDTDGKVERKGAYVKKNNDLDNDMPILNTALVEYMVNKTPVETTIHNCKELKQFQKVVKVSNKFKYGMKNCTFTTIRSKKQWNNDGQILTDKVFRVFASIDAADGGIYKKKDNKNPEKFANTPLKCKIVNSDVNGLDVPSWLDRQYYVDLAKKRLKDYGIEI